MQANLAPEIQIKETDKEFYHVEFTRLEPQGDEPSRPKETKDVQVFTKEAWDDMKKVIKGKGIHILNYHEHRVVHDPLKKQEAKPGPKPKTKTP